jgi:hypothetical protein
MKPVDAIRLKAQTFADALDHNDFDAVALIRLVTLR